MPHGSASGREGLDALLATSALTEDLGVFFIGDGVFQILQGQQPDAVLVRDYIATFKLLGCTISINVGSALPHYASGAFSRGVIL